MCVCTNLNKSGVQARPHQALQCALNWIQHALIASTLHLAQCASSGTSLNWINPNPPLQVVSIQFEVDHAMEVVHMQPNTQLCIASVDSNANVLFNALLSAIDRHKTASLFQQCGCDQHALNVNWMQINQFGLQTGSNPVQVQTGLQIIKLVKILTQRRLSNRRKCSHTMLLLHFLWHLR